MRCGHNTYRVLYTDVVLLGSALTIFGIVGVALGEMSPQYCIVKRIKVNGHRMESFITVPSLVEECSIYELKLMSHTFANFLTARTGSRLSGSFEGLS